MESSEFLELIKKYELPEKEYDKKVSDAHLETISRSSCKHWERLPSHLEMNDIVVSDVRRTQIDEEGKRLEFLRKWREQKGSKATYKQLVLALLKIECRDDAEKVCEILKKPQIHESPPAHDDQGTCVIKEIKPCKINFCLICRPKLKAHTYRISG